MTRFKSFFPVLLLFLVLVLAGCSTNPATGQQQFAALMSPQQEVDVGAREHQKIIAQYGLVNDPKIVQYVNTLGRKVTQDTERPDVMYKFFVLDSPIVNAFALPGGYVYVSRGLLALANSEAELAGVLAHETGHITARHSAERYSTGVVTSLGASVLSAAIGGGTGVSEALGAGTDLYLNGYSRGQESQADSLGLRYMSRGGYDAVAMSSFLSSLQQDSALDNKITGQKDSPVSSYFSTHPPTMERVARTSAESVKYPKGGIINRAQHLQAVNGLVFGDSPAQGFVRGTTFYHPTLGFMFTAPQGFGVMNQTAQVVANAPSGAVVIFDLVEGQVGVDPSVYMGRWMPDVPLNSIEKITVNGMQAATGAFDGQVNGKPMKIRLVAIAWGDKMARFKLGIPQGADPAAIEGLKRMTYSFRPMTTEEQARIQPYRVRLFTAMAGDTVQSVARRMPISVFQEERFRVLNGLRPEDDLRVGEMYKTISD